MAVDLKSTRIDSHDPKFKTMLQNLQGNILKGHGRDHTVHVFLTFTASGADLKKKFKALTTKLVTSAAKQRDETDLFKAFGIPGGPFGNVFLTASGYAKIGLSGAAIGAFTDPLFKNKKASDFMDSSIVAELDRKGFFAQLQ